MNIILALIYKKNVSLFRLVTLNQIDSNKFYHDYVHEDSMSNSDNSDCDNDNEDNSKVNISDININL